MTTVSRDQPNDQKQGPKGPLLQEIHFCGGLNKRLKEWKRKKGNAARSDNVDLTPIRTIRFTHEPSTTEQHKDTEATIKDQSIKVSRNCLLFSSVSQNPESLLSFSPSDFPLNPPTRNHPSIIQREN